MSLNLNSLKPGIIDHIKESIKNNPSYEHCLLLEYPEYDDQHLHLQIIYPCKIDNVILGNYYVVYYPSYEDREEDVKELAKIIGKLFNIPVYEWKKTLVEVKQ
jgi:hypothetical protein